MATSVGEQMQRSFAHDVLIDIILADVIKEHLGGAAYFPRLRAQVADTIRGGKHEEVFGDLLEKAVSQIEGRVRS